VDATLDVKRLDPAFHPSTTKNLVTMMESISGRNATTVSFGTEAAHLSGLTSEVIVFGPGDMTVAHKSGEFVPVKALNECVRYLVELIGSPRLTISNLGP
jgi:acetylornithine deacetylase